LGAAWCALAVWAASFVFGAPVGRVAFVAAGAAAVSAGLFAAAARGGDPGGWRRAAISPRRGRWAAVALGVAGLLVTAALLADAVLHPVTDFDGRMTWGTLARYVQVDRTVLPAAVIDPDAFVVHPRYPVQLPLLQVAAAELAGTTVESRAVRPLYALFLPAMLAALWPAAARAGGRRVAAMALASLGFAPILLWDREVGPLGTYSDLPLAAFLGAAFALLLAPAARRDAWRGVYAGLLLAAAAGSKNEGMVLAPALLLAATWVTWGRGARGALRRAAGVLALGVVLVLAWRVEIPNRNDEGYFEELASPRVVSQLVERAPEIARRVGGSLLDPERWGLAFWLLPPLLVAGSRGLRAGAARASLAALGLQAAVVLTAYGATPDLAVVGVTCDRFAVQALAPLALLAAAAGRAALVAARRRTA
jgi:hypothetical protein